MADESTAPIILPSVCKDCTEPSIDFCKHCGQEFCDTHRSKYNPKLCHNCVSDSNLQLETVPITETDGTTHKGRRFRLIGEGWPAAVQRIHDFDDLELEEYISELTVRLKEAQKNLDYTRILLSAAEYEKSYTGWSRANAARKRREKIQQGAIRLNGKTVKMKTAVDPASKLAQLMGISIEDARALQELLKKK